MKRLLIEIAALLLVAGTARAETATSPVSAAKTNEAPAKAEESETNQWSFSASLTTFFVRHETDYVQPTITADRDWLHLEGRANYEELDTGSLWLGYNFSFGETFTLEFTPMVGGVVGEMYGFAPGYELTFTWWKLELYSEGEYVISASDSFDNFFYNWSSLTLSPVEWFYAGMVTQRTRIDGKDRDIQRGPIVRFTYKWADVNVYCLDPTTDDWTLAFSITLSY